MMLAMLSSWGSFKVDSTGLYAWTLLISNAPGGVHDCSGSVCGCRIQALIKCKISKAEMSLIFHYVTYILMLHAFMGSFVHLVPTQIFKPFKMRSPLSILIQLIATEVWPHFKTVVNSTVGRMVWGQGHVYWGNSRTLHACKFRVWMEFADPQDFYMNSAFTFLQMSQWANHTHHSWDLFGGWAWLWGFNAALVCGEEWQDWDLCLEHGSLGVSLMYDDWGACKPCTSDGDWGQRGVELVVSRQKPLKHPIAVILHFSDWWLAKQYVLQLTVKASDPDGCNQLRWSGIHIHISWFHRGCRIWNLRHKGNNYTFITKHWRCGHHDA